MPKGFLFSTAEAAIKKPGRKDLALIYSVTEANIAGTFTTNKIKAAPVKVDIRKIRSGKGQGIIINSGNANACTGEKGLQDVKEMINLVARGLRINPSLVYACSTGVIGCPMPMDRLRPQIPVLLENLGKSTIEDVAKAIMTTDTFPKIVKKRVTVGNKAGNIIGICKGAGMIWPHMATMLCFVMTDVAVEKETLNDLMIEAVERSFNKITVDGDRSTNDTALIMANGTLGNRPITGKSSVSFKNALNEVTYELSKMIVKDGEGATKLVRIKVKGAASVKEAEKAAFTVANSNLVKTAIYGNDANWGRIMAALGYSGVKIKENKTDIYVGNIKIVSKGIGTFRDEEATRAFRNKEVNIVIDLHNGRSSSKVLTCDLSEDYVRLNAAYKT
ncbi:MAG: bifunctional glutamate N-acetyltransferase/amino-acid acetyltransferase ArgJ [Nitrospirota bacterium]